MGNIDKIIDELIQKKNELAVRKQTVNLTAGSLGNPKISVGVLPFYEWSKSKKVTYVITGGRYLDCRMLVDRAYKNDSDFVVTNNYARAKQLVRNIIASYVIQLNSQATVQA